MKNPRITNQIFPAIRDDIADLQTHRAMPTPTLSMIDPFLFLNHHGHQVYAPKNQGLPFGPHPHRGFETVTFILRGDISHKDSSGHESVIKAGGVQWMTAGSGLIHSETSSDEFKKQGGELEILQLWVNLPAKLKMTKPKYIGLQADEIPLIKKDPSVSIQLVSGDFEDHKGPFETLTDISTMVISLKTKSELSLKISSARSIFFYVINGAVEVNGRNVSARETLTFKNEGSDLEIKSSTNSEVLLCHGLAYGEDVVSYGPFVMNSKEEIQKAISDYQNGKFN